MIYRRDLVQFVVWIMIRILCCDHRHPLDKTQTIWIGSFFSISILSKWTTKRIEEKIKFDHALAKPHTPHMGLWLSNIVSFRCSHCLNRSRNFHIKKQFHSFNFSDYTHFHSTISQDLYFGRLRSILVCVCTVLGRRSYRTEKKSHKNVLIKVEIEKTEIKLILYVSRSSSVSLPIRLLGDFYHFVVIFACCLESPLFPRFLRVSSFYLNRHRRSIFICCKKRPTTTTMLQEEESEISDIVSLTTLELSFVDNVGKILRRLTQSPSQSHENEELKQKKISSCSLLRISSTKTSTMLEYGNSQRIKVEEDFGKKKWNFQVRWLINEEKNTKH